MGRRCDIDTNAINGQERGDSTSVAEMSPEQQGDSFDGDSHIILYWPVCPQTERD